MTIRFAENRDIPGIIKLLRQVGRVHGEGRPDLFRHDALKYNEDDLALLLRDKDRPILIAAEENDVLGYAFCVRKETRDHPVLRDQVTLYIDDLCVDETIRSRGIGTALYRRARTLARELGCANVTLNVWAFNESALAFYRKCGMTPQRIFMEAILEESEC